MKEDYVSFETAKLLKEKGFNQITNMAYMEGHLTQVSHFEVEHNPDRFDCYVYTQTMVMKWLREVHNIFIQIELYSKHNDYCFELFQNTHRLMVEKREVYNSYESACESAIKYCLEHLI